MNLLAWFTCPSSLSSYRSVSGCGCLAIGDLAAEKDNLVRLTQSGACEAAVGALRRHDDVPDVVVQACYAIHFLCFSQNNIAWMGANGTRPSPTQPQFSVLSSHPYPSIPIHLSIPIHINAGACEAVTQALTKHISDDLMTTQSTARAVGSLAFKDEGNQVRLSGPFSLCLTLSTLLPVGLVPSYLCPHVLTL